MHTGTTSVLVCAICEVCTAVGKRSAVRPSYTDTHWCTHTNWRALKTCNPPSSGRCMLKFQRFEFSRMTVKAAVPHVQERPVICPEMCMHWEEAAADALALDANQKTNFFFLLLFHLVFFGYSSPAPSFSLAQILDRTLRAHKTWLRWAA